MSFTALLPQTAGDRREKRRREFARTRQPGAIPLNKGRESLSNISGSLINVCLARSVKDLCGLLELFEKRKVALISVAEALDTGSAAGRLVITIMGAVSQWEREAIGERTRDALRHKRGNGERVGNIEFGFRLSADLRHLEPAPTEQAALAEIRNLRRQGHTLRGIAATLNNRGYRTRRGTDWRLESVARVIKQNARQPHAKIA